MKKKQFTLHMYHGGRRVAGNNCFHRDSMSKEIPKQGQNFQGRFLMNIHSLKARKIFAYTLVRSPSCHRVGMAMLYLKCSPQDASNSDRREAHLFNINTEDVMVKKKRYGCCDTRKVKTLDSLALRKTYGGTNG